MTKIGSFRLAGIAAAVACAFAVGGCGAYLKDAHGNAVSLRGYRVLSIDPVEVADADAPAWVGPALDEQLDKHFPAGKLWLRANPAQAAAGADTGEPGARLKLTLTAACVCTPGQAGEQCLAEARVEVFDDRSDRLLGHERLRQQYRGAGDAPADEEHFRKVVLCRLSCEASRILADARSASAEWEAQTTGCG